MRFAAIDVVLSSDRRVFPPCRHARRPDPAHEFTGEVPKLDGEETDPKRITCGCFAWLYLLADLPRGARWVKDPARPRMPRTHGDGPKGVSTVRVSDIVFPARAGMNRRRLPHGLGHADSLLTRTSRPLTWS